MAWESLNVARGALAQIQAYVIKGLGADRIYNTIRKLWGGGRGERSPVPREYVRNVTRTFREAVQSRVITFPTRRSERFRADMAVPSDMLSPLEFRYLLDFQFKARNVDTGEIVTMTNTIGFRRLDRLGSFINEARSRLEAFNRSGQIGDSDFYQRAGEFVADLDSIEFVALVRTLNR